MIEGIDTIIYATDKWQETRQFFDDWGLKNTQAQGHYLEWVTLNGSKVAAVPLASPRYAQQATLEAGATLREVVWGVTEAKNLTAFADILKNAAGFKQSETQVSALDPHNLRITFQLSQKRAIDVQGSPSNPYGLVGRVNQPSPVYERAVPIEIGHVVLFTDKLAEAVLFYQKLGFVLSDSYPNRGVFLRCAEEGGHHDIFLLQLPNKPSGLNHIAFTVRDIHEVFGGGLAMSRAGWKTQLGPGRHPISSAYFWYFECPAGGLIEYNADEDHLTGDWQPREFAPSPTAFAEWAIDGGLDGFTRRQPQVAASGAFLTERKN